VKTVQTLSVWRFDSSSVAESALRSLERLQTRGAIEFDDVAVVVWAIDARRPQAYQVGSAAGPTELTGAFWGLLFALLFLLPRAGPTSGLHGLAEIGLDDGFLARVRARIVPGTSALFLLGTGDLPDRVEAALADTHCEAVVSTLSTEQQAALRQAFAADDLG
jgi:uncharacterized membrane protein